MYSGAAAAAAASAFAYYGVPVGGELVYASGIAVGAAGLAGASAHGYVVENWTNQEGKVTVLEGFGAGMLTLAGAHLVAPAVAVVIPTIVTAGIADGWSAETWAVRPPSSPDPSAPRPFPAAAARCPRTG